MLNSGKKIRAPSDKKYKYSISCVVRKKISERNKKPYPPPPPPPFKLNGRSLKCSVYERLRYDLLVNLSCHLNINNLLFADSNPPDWENESNFLVIQDSIIQSKRCTPRI